MQNPNPKYCPRHPNREYQKICPFPGCNSPFECRECRNLCYKLHAEWLLFDEESNYKVEQVSCQINESFYTFDQESLISYLQKIKVENLEKYQVREEQKKQNIQYIDPYLSEPIIMECRAEKFQQQDVGSSESQILKSKELIQSISFQSLLDGMIEKYEDNCLSYQEEDALEPFDYLTSWKDPPFCDQPKESESNFVSEILSEKEDASSEEEPEVFQLKQHITFQPEPNDD